MSDSLRLDFYALTMVQAHLRRRYNPLCCFDMFLRELPFQGGYAIFAGLGSLLTDLTQLRCNEEELDYLRGLGMFDTQLLDYLRHFSFSGSIWAIDEGSIVFPHQPLLRCQGPLLELLLLEARILNALNYQTLVATKAARLQLASEGRPIIEMGLRRAFGPDGALSASRAAFIGGAAGTSNVEAGRKLGLPVFGTMAHSWVMSFPSEVEAFRSYAQVFPQRPVFLLDTYHTLECGLPSAIQVGLELKAQGLGPVGVRLDSGDLHYLSCRVRQQLDQAGLQDTFIIASSDLDEWVIEQLIDDHAPINYFGVGTSLVSARGSSPLSGVFKPAAQWQSEGPGPHWKPHWKPLIKISNHIEKCSTPGIKQVYRFFDQQDLMVADLVCLETEPMLPPGRSYRCHHPMVELTRSFLLKPSDYTRFIPLLKPCLVAGVATPQPSLVQLQQRCQQQLAQLEGCYRRLLNPHIYKVSLSSQLCQLKFNLIRAHLPQQGSEEPEENRSSSAGEAADPPWDGPQQ